MANIYESDDFNIISVHTYGAENWDEYNQQNTTTYCLLAKVQRLPLAQFPNETDVFINSDDGLNYNCTKEEFLAAAPAIITSKLTEFDSEFSGEENTPLSTESLTQNFT